MDPFNKKNYTSYTLNKNVIGMCMREKNVNKNNNFLSLEIFVKKVKFINNLLTKLLTSIWISFDVF